METTATTGRFVEPEKAITHFHLRPGDKVADFGAGSGYFTKILAETVGEEGCVYACEIQKSLTETVGNIARQHNLENVHVLWCDVESPGGTKIAADSLDAALLINTLFQLEAKDSAMKEIHRTLRPGGKLIIIDWSESFGGLGPLPEQVINAEAVKALGETHGFIFEREFDAGDHHYGLAFKKV